MCFYTRVREEVKEFSLSFSFSVPACVCVSCVQFCPDGCCYLFDPSLDRKFGNFILACIFMATIQVELFLPVVIQVQHPVTLFEILNITFLKHKKNVCFKTLCLGDAHVCL